MKTTLKDLKKIIETTIKPFLPDVDNEETLEKIDMLSRKKDYQLDADSFASSYGYPEDRSYSKDLAVYDKAGEWIIDRPASGFSQKEIDKQVDEFFQDSPGRFFGSISIDGMTLREIAELFIEWGMNINNHKFVYDENGKINYPEISYPYEYEELVRRYELSLSRPYIKKRNHLT